MNGPSVSTTSPPPRTVVAVVDGCRPEPPRSTPAAMPSLLNAAHGAIASGVGSKSISSIQIVSRYCIVMSLLGLWCAGPHDRRGSTHGRTTADRIDRRQNANAPAPLGAAGFPEHACRGLD